MRGEDGEGKGASDSAGPRRARSGAARAHRQRTQPFGNSAGRRERRPGRRIPCLLRPDEAAGAVAT